jgi:hypothetical protein
METKFPTYIDNSARSTARMDVLLRIHRQLPFIDSMDRLQALVETMMEQEVWPLPA